MRQAGYPAFQITEQNAQGQLVRAAARQEYMAVTYIEPSAGNESALGYDVASETDRLMALHSARDTGTPRATGRLMLVQETSQQHGLLIFLPLYSSGLPRHGGGTPPCLHGYVTGVFRIGDMMGISLRTARDSLRLQLEDAMAPVGERLLYSHQWGGPERSFHEAERSTLPGCTGAVPWRWLDACGSCGSRRRSPILPSNAPGMRGALSRVDCCLLDCWVPFC